MNALDVLGVPVLSQDDIAKLLARHAPALDIDVGGAYDEPCAEA